MAEASCDLVVIRDMHLSAADFREWHLKLPRGRIIPPEMSLRRRSLAKEPDSPSPTLQGISMEGTQGSEWE